MVSTLLPPTHNLHCANNNSGDRSLGLRAELAVILGSSDWLSGLHDETVLSGLCYPLLRHLFFFCKSFDKLVNFFEVTYFGDFATSLSE